MDPLENQHSGRSPIAPPAVPERMERGRVEDAIGRAGGTRQRVSRLALVGPFLRFCVSLRRLNRTRGLVHDNQTRLDNLERELRDAQQWLREARRELQDAQQQEAGERQSFARNQRELNVALLEADERFKTELYAANARHKEAFDAARERTAAEQRAMSGRLSALAANVELLGRASLMRGTSADGSADRDGGPAGEGALLDDFYVALEQRFRGSIDDIADRQRAYLPDIADVMASMPPQTPILDLGCGRGEWLKVLRSKGFAGIGVDTNAGQLAAARSEGLAVVEGDGLAFMRDQPEAHFAAVTAFHLVEHLPFPVLAQWFVEIHRILRPGGRLILETPNPENLIVGAFTFHIDPTHQRPLPSGVLEVLAQSTGFAVTTVRPLHPHARLGHGLETLPTEVAYLLYGYQDYGLIAQKPSGVGS